MPVNSHTTDNNIPNDDFKNRLLFSFQCTATAAAAVIHKYLKKIHTQD